MAALEITPLHLHQAEAFLAWRGEDEISCQIVRGEVEAHFVGQRVLWVAVLGEAMVGTVQLLFDHPDPDLADEHSGYIQALEVRPAYRRLGIASALLQRVEWEARRRGLERITLMVEPDNAPALRLYRKWGYRQFKRSVFGWKGVMYPTLCLEKLLAPV
ncbi:GNAT family N-acetyltransferase [Calidithermus roseus]|uniref:Acetyltransferase YpeA n=1 Tax=Calidithermus roseus TaxID=1644118 RepID=A0A399ERG0_9DEIN|nr:GNAT family N-acetyltransferase [Calidithermus roseus]RIH86548.1 Acetyltransferase YpeA [Calidithermus roseus]